MIAIVNYGVGNVRAFSNIYESLNIPVILASTAEDLNKATRIILPGVGAFDHAMQRLNDSGMREKLEEKVIKEKLPVIGICVGMQMLANRSDEGKEAGLGWIEGTVRKFDVSKIPYHTRLPHMGWNDVTPIKQSRLFEGLEKNARFYFLHSFYFECAHSEDTMAVADYGGEFSCVVGRNNVYGVQCHPEKSHKFGIQLLKNFANL